MDPQLNAKRGPLGSRSDRHGGSEPGKRRRQMWLGIAVLAILVIVCGVLYGIYSNLDDPAQDGQQAQDGGGGQAPADDTNAGDGPASGGAGEDGGSDEGGSSVSDPADEPGGESGEASEPEATGGTETDEDAGAAGGESSGESSGAAVDSASGSGSTGSNGASGGGTSGNGGAADERSFPTTYTVRKGDTLSSISARFYGSKQYVALLAEHNGIVLLNDMKVGTKLKIPAPSSGADASERPLQDYTKVELPATYLVQAGDTFYRLSQQFYGSRDYAALIARHNGLAATDDLKAGSNLEIPPLAAAEQEDGTAGGWTHTVQRGDTLYSIARQYYGSGKHAATIAEANGLADGDQLQAGAQLEIPEL
ncbi:LysM peptidoglycan-binding domain-containing protein [Paenibacillus sp. IB182496]|uniref:LysM peptidoglycan-binding domain-containing protein n=1 Tax=Paenibacillus sabuli TaxID=2772509 RepID=A0A927BRM3_9BACL|nr:LysM domain-containing protein [Paenibacillus sabuli]MBD2845501.1 LysM peptidoglycan-binding domain-containing protein [Paenibacillus sabuli]